MSAQIEIVSVTGTFPVDVYVSDVYGNNLTYLGSINSVPQTFVLPALFNFAPAVIIKLIDSEGCEDFQIKECISDFPTPTPTPSVSPTISETPTQTPTPTGTGTSTPTPTPTITESPSPTPTPDASASATPTPTPTLSETGTPTPTPTISETATPTPTPTITESPSPTPTPDASASATPTPTPTISETATPTPTPTISETATPTPTPTISETATPTPTPTISETATPTPTPTITQTISETPTNTPTPTPTPSLGCPQCTEYEISVVNFENCGEAFYYTDCISQQTIQIGGQFGNQINAWFDPNFGANPLTICSCDEPDLTILTGCSASAINMGPCDLSNICECYVVDIQETDNPGSNPIHWNVQSCDGVFQTITFTTAGVYNYCVRQHFNLYQSSILTPPWGAPSASSVIGPGVDCTNTGICP